MGENKAGSAKRNLRSLLGTWARHGTFLERTKAGREGLLVLLVLLGMVGKLRWDRHTAVELPRARPALERLPSFCPTPSLAPWRSGLFGVRLATQSL